MEKEREIVTIFKVHYKVDYGKLIVHLSGRRHSDNTRWTGLLHNTIPHFYIPQQKIDHIPIEARGLISNVRKEGLTLDNEELLRIETNYPYDVPNVRKYFPITYEADIKYRDRIMYDLGFKHTISVPKGKMHLKPSDIIPRDDVKPISPRIICLDLENDDSEGLALPKYPTAEVYCFTIYDNFTDTYYLYISGDQWEKELRQNIEEHERIKPLLEEGKKVKVIRVKDEYRLFMAMKMYFDKLAPDIITGWNVDGYDVAYLTARAKNNDFQCPEFREYAVFDGLKGYRHLHDGELMEGGSLEFVAWDELGEGKVERVGIKDMYDRADPLLAVYNIKDVELSWKIVLKLDVIEGFHLPLAQYAGCCVEDTTYEGHMIDAYLLHRLEGKLILPTRGVMAYHKIQKGGSVSKPFCGIENWIVKVDLKAEYSQIIISGNLSPETLIPNLCDHCYNKDSSGGCGDYELEAGGTSGIHMECVDFDPMIPCFIAESKRAYKLEPVGLIPMIIKELLIERDRVQKIMKTLEFQSDPYKVKDRHQTVLKYFIHSFWGSLGSEGFRLTSGHIGDDILATGRAHINWIDKFLATQDCLPLYHDTDGTHFKPPKEWLEKPDDWPGRKLDYLLYQSEELVKKLNVTFDDFAAQFNITKHYLRIKVDKILETFFQWGKKKRYVELLAFNYKSGDVTKAPIEKRIKIVGAAAKRSSSSPFTRATQKELFITAVQQSDIKGLISWFKQKVEDVYSGKFDTDLGTPIGWGAMKYRGRNPPYHVIAARYSNKHLGQDFKVGDKPRIYKMKTVRGVKEKPKNMWIALPWGVPPSKFGKLDYDFMAEKVLFKPLRPIIEDGMGLNIKALVEGRVAVIRKNDDWKEFLADDQSDTGKTVDIEIDWGN